MIRCCTIVVTYNSLKWVDRCFSSLQNSTFPVRILVVDNASTDGTLGHLREKFPFVEIHPLKENIGFGKANNIGILKAMNDGFEYIFLVNHDVWIEPNTADYLIRQLATNQTFGILSPMHLKGSGSGLDENFKNYLIRSGLNIDELKNIHDMKPIRASFVNAACWMLSSIAVKKVGLFHPLFHHYGEDDNYVKRLHNEDLRIGVVPGLRIYHDRENRKGNPIKTEIKSRFRREVLQELLDPTSKKIHLKHWLSARKKAKRGKQLSLTTRIRFYFESIVIYSKTLSEVDRFEQEENVNPFSNE